jgi:hypothetical protein
LNYNIFFNFYFFLNTRKLKISKNKIKYFFFQKYFCITEINSAKKRQSGIAGPIGLETGAACLGYQFMLIGLYCFCSFPFPSATSPFSTLIYNQDMLS